MSLENLAKKPRLPSLDGWRAVSILLVLGSHNPRVFDFPQRLDRLFMWSFDGGLGVRFFFVISGFLITFLLLKEHGQTGGINLKNFYFRRALRILPVYFAFLLVMLCLQLFTVWHQEPVTWLGNVTFLTNVLPGNWNTGHLWSLAVEEQFYILWPVLLCLIGRPAGSNRRLYLVLAIPLVTAPICRVIGYERLEPPLFHSFFEGHSFFTNFDSLAIGCIAGVVFAESGRVAGMLGSRPQMLLVTALFLLAVPYVLGKLLICGIFTVPLGDSCEAAGLGLILLQSVWHPRLFQPLAWLPVAQLGVLSYSIYIWQQLFCTNPKDFGFVNPTLMSFPFWMVGAIGAAAISYYCLERPLLNLRSRLRPSPQKVGTGA
jgi:peptidoglycan/LPS O-acetylase OafA/YrhL